jgi:hypothetical protein
MDYLPLASIPLGVLIWAVFIRPFQMRNHERRRRAHGLPPKRRLPEDDT